jgi:hypothetical protein
MGERDGVRGGGLKAFFSGEKGWLFFEGDCAVSNRDEGLGDFLYGRV